MKVLQKGFNYSQDGPGNRLVYHLQGCNFRCKWCSNADSIPLENEAAKECSIDEIFEEILRSKMMFFDGGGVTFTGGECTLQHLELLPLLQKIKNAGINTCIETNGSVPQLKEMMEYIDYLIVDFKHPNDIEHKKWVNHSNKEVKENIEYILKLGRQIHIRIPLIGGVNICPESFAQYFNDFDTSNAVFEFLTYHEYGKDKWQGRYEMTNAFVTKEELKNCEEIFEKYNLKLIKT